MYQGIFWSNDWDGQTDEHRERSKAYMNAVSYGGVGVAGLLLLMYGVSLCLPYFKTINSPGGVIFSKFSRRNFILIIAL